MHQLDLFIKRLFFTSLLLFAAEFPSWAQTVYPETMPQRGISPNGSYSFDKNESINKLNGILTYTIPLTTMPLGRAGMSIPINLAYSSALYDYSYRQTLNGSTPVIVRDIVGSPWGGWSFQGFSYSLSPLYKNNTVTGAECQTGDGGYNFKLSLILPDHSHHDLKLFGQFDNNGDSFYRINDSGLNVCTGATLPSPLTYYTSDGTYIKVVLDTSSKSYTIFLPNGNVVTSTGAIFNRVQTIQDRNGNKITIRSDPSSSTVLTDDLGRTLTLPILSSSGTETITQTSVGGSTLTWTISSSSFTTPTFSYQCGVGSYSSICSTSLSGGGVTSLQVPSDSGPLTYSFAYNQQNGELQAVTSPSGASTTYTFSSATQPSVNQAVVEKQVTWTDGSDGGSVQRTEPWSYTYNIPLNLDYLACYSNCTTVTTQPDGGKETVYFHSVSGGAFDPFFGLPVKDVKPSGETTEYLYYQNRPYGGQGIDPANPYPYLTVHSMASAGSPTVAAVIAQTIDKNGNPTKVTAYDWISYSSLPHDGSGTLSGFAPGTVLRNTVNTYTVTTSDAGTGSESIADNGSAYWNPSSPSLRSLLASSTVTGAGAGAGSVAGYAYDNNGNLQHERHWDSSRALSAPAVTNLNRSNASVTDRTFDSHGNLTQIADPNGNTTNYTYDSNNLYLTSSVQGWGTSAALTTNYAYDFNTGLPVSQTDANNVRTCYGYDALGRSTSVTVSSTDCWNTASLALASTRTTYEDANRRVIVRKDLNTPGDGALMTVTKYDQLGRVTLTRQLENASQGIDDDTAGIKIQTRYQSSGTTYQLVSNPYRAATSTAASTETSMGWMVTKFDQNGRVVSSQSFDGSGLPFPWGNNTNSSGTVMTAYNAQTTTVTDQAGAVRQSSTDGLGRLAQVIEDPGTSPHLNYTTVYGYDALDDLTCINQGSIGANNTCDKNQPHARQFTYDSLKRLTQAVNPESGATSYTYDANGNLQTKTDANNITTTYGVYDALNRVTGKSYSGGQTSSVTYTYDDSKVPNAKGRLTKVTNGSVVVSYSAYDFLGRVTQSNEQIGAKVYPFQYTYNLAGSLTSETYPSGRVVATCYDGANRVSQISGSQTTQPNCANNQASSTQINYVSGVTYAPHSAPSQYLYGNSLGRSYTYNSRLQPTLVKDAINYADGFILLRLWPNWGTTSNNGNLLSVLEENGGGPTQSTFLSFTQTFAYDAVNRLQSASETNGGTPTWSRSFGYDQYGNSCVGHPLGIDAPTTPACTQNSAGQWIVLPPTAYDSHNRLTLNAPNFDAAGNQQAANGNTLAYDAENRQVSVTSSNAGGGTETYAYDGQGRRVQRSGPDGVTTYVYDAFDQLAAEYATVPAATTGCTPCYLSADHLGSVRLVTKADGTVLARHDYLPFGEEIASNQAGRNSQFGISDNVSQRFTGQEHDTESGLDYFRARYYGSALGRFTSPDPDNAGAWLSDPQGWNMYAYGRNNPLKYVDPLGESYQICDVNGQNCAQDQLSDSQFDSEKQAAQSNGEHFNNGTMYHYNSDGNRINDGTYRQTDVDIDPSLATGLHNAGVQSSAFVNSFMRDMAVNAVGGFVLAGAGTAISELWPGIENLPLLRQVSRIPSNNTLKHIVNQGHLAQFQALDPSLTLDSVVDIGINVAETGTKIGTNTFIKTMTIGGQQIEVKAVLNPNNGLRSVFPKR